MQILVLKQKLHVIFLYAEQVSMYWDEANFNAFERKTCARGGA